jgi:hypothetical protein
MGWKTALVRQKVELRPAAYHEIYAIFSLDRQWGCIGRFSCSIEFMAKLSGEVTVKK